ncbi:hypothetical protein EDC01DRAFT_628776 [Geopyxis carbonaria]|nr:hypothetical protein EDC01DRAFT_628776 [Geopyxis carbonaria]
MPSLTRRDDDPADDNGWGYGDDDGPDEWYLSGEASSIKYGILFGILALAALLIAGSWFHARQRMKKGVAPLRYHRWLVPRSQRAIYEPHLRGGGQPEQNFTFYNHQQQQQQGYDMNTVPPPPAYNPNFAQPPVYAGALPPVGTAKNPFQDPPAVGGEGSSGVQPPQQVHYAPPPPSGAPPSYH